MNRSTRTVFLDHLERAQKADVDGDIKTNFSPDCVLLTTYGTFRGYSGLREAYDLLERQLGRTTYTYQNKMCEGEIAFLEWSADTDRASVSDGADSYLIRDGRIVAMTIHYTVNPKAQ